jgi:hypothetical protein
MEKRLFEWCKRVSGRGDEVEFDNRPGSPTIANSDEYAEKVRTEAE